MSGSSSLGASHIYDISISGVLVGKCLLNTGMNRIRTLISRFETYHSNNCTIGTLTRNVAVTDLYQILNCTLYIYIYIYILKECTLLLIKWIIKPPKRNYFCQLLFRFQ